MKKLIFAIAFISASFSQAHSQYSAMYISSRTEMNQGAGTPNTCTLELGEYDLNYAIEWQVSDISPLWTETNPFSGHKITNDNDTACSNTTSCFVHGQRSYSKASMYINKQGVKEHFQPNKAYYFAARQFIDSNKNGNQDPGEFVREWSRPVQVTNSSDYNHRCTFNTFPNR